ncbi:MAG TPA: glycosyltransferase family 9 protein, partial [Candidatus Manganitrophaceae bacterium]|nr:glycosyltransferase family 9 protein [Candidatus Manganitrophaceae bacterium]
MMYKKILIRAPNWIGDAVMAIPTLSALRAHFKESEIALLAKPPVAALLENHPTFDRLIVFEDPGRHSGWRGRWRLIRSLRKERFDLAFLLQNAFEAALIAALAGVPERVGYAADGRGFLLTRSLPKRSAPLRQSEFYYDLTRLFPGANEGGAPGNPYLIVTGG